MLAFLTDGWSDRFVSAINGVLAWVACMAHVYAASRTSGKLRAMFIGIGSLALFYSFAYWWLFFNPTEALAWSNFLRPVSIFAWVIAWAVEPIIMIKYLQRSGRQVIAHAEEKAKGAREFLDHDERMHPS